MNQPIPADLIPADSTAEEVKMPLRCDTPFVIVYSGRSGAGDLQEMLNEHADISCRGEIVTRKIKHEGWVEKKGDRPTALSRVLKRVYSSKEPGTRGFLFKRSEFDEFPEVAKSLWGKRKKIRCIFLERRNHLRSALLAQNYAKGKREGDGSPAVGGKLVADVGKAIANARRREAGNQALAAFADGFSQHMTVAFEDLVAQPDQTLAKCHEFLGVSPQAAGAKRATDQRFEDFVENAAELRQAANDAGMQRYLD